MAPHALVADETSVPQSFPLNGAKSSLKILVIGAGIAGLSAAISLRRAGHDVEVSSAIYSATLSMPLA